jgi:inosine-uridine nucleoside N-ribohydrolase
MATRVLFDVDPGCDDALMLASALGHPGIEVAGVTTVAGNTTVENATANARSILSFAGAEDIPIARGCERPLVGDLTTAEWVHGPRGLRGRDHLPSEPPEGTVDVHAAEFIVEAAREHGEDLTIAAVGPQTNLALAVALDPRLPDLVGDIYVMGGATAAPGNVTPAAEANVHNDPEAASRVIQDCGVTLVGLDVTMSATVPADLVADPAVEDRWSGLLADWLDYPADVADAVTGEGYAIHDAAVAADLAADDPVLTAEPYHVEIDSSAGPARGATICDYHGVGGVDPNARVAVDIDVAGFREYVREGVRRLR